MKWSPARAARKGQVPCVSERLKGEGGTPSFDSRRNPRGHQLMKHNKKGGSYEKTTSSTSRFELAGACQG
jgi:hypothetical protein